MVDWVARAAAGETGPLKALFHLFAPRVRRLAAAFAELDSDEVEDVVQETFSRAFQHLARLGAPQAFDAWLFTIARNRARSHLSRKTLGVRAAEIATEGLPEHVGLWPEALRAERQAEVVRDFITHLPPGPERETVRLFYVEGVLSAREIAERLGVGKSAITMRLERFRGRVKRELLRQLLAAEWE